MTGIYRTRLIILKMNFFLSFLFSPPFILWAGGGGRILEIVDLFQVKHFTRNVCFFFL